MDSQAIHDAMRNHTPVRYNGLTYTVKEYISWFDSHGHHRLSVGLVKDNTYVRVPADKVEGLCTTKTQKQTKAKSALPWCRPS